VPAGVGDPGRVHPQRQEPAALQALAATPPDELHTGLLPSVEGKLGQRARAVAVARPGTAALARGRRSGGVHLLGVGAGVGPDLHHVGHLAGVQPQRNSPASP
jgi:hypothetical protein